MVMATQNPIEYEGTYPLPEAELDRFTMRITIGYPPLATRRGCSRADDRAAARLAGAGRQRGRTCSARPRMRRQIYVEESLNRYVVTVLRQTRSDQRLYLGASPRAGIALLRVAKSRALSEGRDYVAPEDVKVVASAVLAHRLILAPEARSSGLDADGDRRGHHRAHAGSGLGRLAVLTDRGRYALALGGVTYLAGWAFGSDALYPVAVGLVLVVVGAALWVRLLAKPVRLRRSIRGGNHVAGDDVPVSIELELRGPGRSPPR